MRPSRRKWAAVKPPTAAINWSHPLARGLVNGALLTHESTTSIRTIRGEGMTISAGSLAAEWNVAAGGWVWRDPGAHVFTLTTGYVPLDYPFTVVARTAARVGNNGTHRRCLSFGAAAGASPFGVGWASTTGAAAGLSPAGAEASTVVGLDTMVSLGYVGESITARHLSVNGIRKVTDTNSRAMGTNVQLRVGDSVGNCFYDLAYGLVYDRALTQGELQWLAVEPYAFCVAPRRQWFGALLSQDIVLVDSGSGGSTNGLAAAVTGALNTTGADFIVVATGDYDAGISGGSTVTDSLSNTWTPLTLYIEGGASSQIRLHYCIPPEAKTGAGHTFTSTTPGGFFYGSIAAAAFNNVHATPFEQETGAEQASVTTKKPGAVTPAQDGELVVTAIVGSTGANVSSVDESMTIVENVAYSAGAHLSLALAYIVQTSAAAIDPEWTMASSATVSTALATFKAAGGAPAAGNALQWRLLLLGSG